jgi:hypothetical protein
LLQNVLFSKLTPYQLQSLLMTYSFNGQYSLLFITNIVIIDQ